MQKIRLRTQSFPQELLLSDEDIYKLQNAVLSLPKSGEYRVFTIQLTEEGGWRIEWNEDPEP